MRLINTGDYTSEEFFGDSIPPYVILSHTWGIEEVTYQDIVSGTGAEKKGFEKVKGCCAQASKDGYKYVWIDTCCIDKTSSAELSEAINSMYQWYQKSDICYVYLDVVLAGPQLPAAGAEVTFLNCRWFTRGWTLQELLAPSIVEFYDRHWSDYGTKSSLQDVIERRTGIKKWFLNGMDRSSCSVAERMSWAAGRRTTRVEDEAYCLLGIFQVNMPLLYGEGRRSFTRLQEEILKQTEDQTLLAWPGRNLCDQFQYQSPRQQRTPLDMASVTGLLATSPADFEDWQEIKCSDLIPVRLLELPMTSSYRFSKEVLKTFGIDLSGTVPAIISGRGMQLSLLVEQGSLYDITVAFLCRTVKSRSIVCVKLARSNDGRYVRMRNSPPYLQNMDKLSTFSLMNIYAAPWVSESPESIVKGVFVATFKIVIAYQALEILFTWTCQKKAHSPLIRFTTDWPSTLAGVTLLKYRCPSSSSSCEFFMIAFGLFRSTPWCKIIPLISSSPSSYSSQNDMRASPSVDTQATSKDQDLDYNILVEETYQKLSVGKSLYSSYYDRAVHPAMTGDELHVAARRQSVDTNADALALAFELRITLKSKKA